MAKKKQEMTVEEKLAAALVREDEQPYKVPGNWVWTRLDKLKNNENGFFDGDWILSQNMDINGEVRLIQLSDIGIGSFLDKSSKHINSEKFDELGCKELIEGDILISRMAEPIVRSFIFPKLTYKCITVVDVAVLRCNNNLVNRKFANYLFNTPWFTELAMSIARGTTRVRITRKNLGELPIPLPPLAEQQRIVDRIESLFDQLDQAKALIQEALDSFATRKAAILHQAFTGQLTKSRLYEKTNILNNMEKVKNDLISRKIIQRPKKIEPILETGKEAVTPKLWQIAKLGEIAFVTKLAGFEYTKYIHLEESGEIPVIRAQNVRSGYLDLRNLLYINSETSSLLNRSALYKKCLVITFIGAGIGDISVFNSEIRYHLAPNVAKIELYNSDEKEYVLSEFILYYLLSPLGQKQVFKHMKATAQPSLSMATIRDIVVPLPSIEEQQEIVRILDDLFAKEQDAKDLCDQIDQIDTIKKTILGKAFRGELGTNVAGEESAMALLKAVFVGK